MAEFRTQKLIAIGYSCHLSLPLFVLLFVMLKNRSMGYQLISVEYNLSECSLTYAVQMMMQIVPFCSFAMTETVWLLRFA